MLQQVCGLEGDRLWTVASGFGGGIARYQSVCGAVSAGVMALGLFEGRLAQDLGPKKVSTSTNVRVRQVMDGFKEKFGSLECRGLSAYDFNAPGGYEGHQQSGEKQERCHHYVRYVVETIAKEFEGER